MAEFHAVDGTALAPTDFGKFNADGVWVPKKVTGVTYGTNGFYLDFSDPADIGADRSGNGNNWTPTGFELTDTTSTSYDSMADSPTNNYGTWNPLVHGTDRDTAITNGNLKADFNPSVSGAHAAANPVYCSIEVPKSGHYYLEWTSSGAVNYSMKISTKDPSAEWSGTGEWGYSYLYKAGYPSNGGYTTLTAPATATNTGSPSWYGDGTVHGVEFDMDNNTLRYTQNGTLFLTQSNCNFADFEKFWFSMGTATNGISGSSPNLNTGQLPFQHQPAGTEPLSTANLPDVAITKPSDHFQTILDTGANILTAAQAKFPNGLWWIKDRTGSNQHQLVDSVRGGNLAVHLPDKNEQDSAYVAPAGNSVAWCWNLLPDRSNGFDIVTWTGDGAAGRKVSHALAKKPAFIITCKRNIANTDIATYHQSLGATKGTYLSLNLSSEADIGFWNNTEPTVNDFTVGVNRAMNQGGANYVGYLWTEIPGYSSIGSYVGNGNSDGAFVYTGHRPAWILLKCTSSSGEAWFVLDTTRTTYNPSLAYLVPSSAQAEVSDSTNLQIDILSNGFKLRSGGGNVNGSGYTYMFMSVAEHPFGGSNISPAPAR